jgi:hypothetical protein
MSLSEIRKELREMRKSVVKPVSKMKKADCVAELERMKMMNKKEEKMEKVIHKEEEKAVKKVMKETVKKVSEVQKKHHEKEEKPKEDMSEKMARLRAMRKSKKEE